MHLHARARSTAAPRRRADQLLLFVLPLSTGASSSASSAGPCSSRRRPLRRWSRPMPRRRPRCRRPRHRARVRARAHRLVLGLGLGGGLGGGLARRRLVSLGRRRLGGHEVLERDRSRRSRRQRGHVGDRGGRVERGGRRRGRRVERFGVAAALELLRDRGTDAADERDRARDLQRGALHGARQRRALASASSPSWRSWRPAWRPWPRSSTRALPAATQTMSSRRTQRRRAPGLASCLGAAEVSCLLLVVLGR